MLQYGNSEKDDRDDGAGAMEVSATNSAWSGKVHMATSLTCQTCIIVTTSARNVGFA